MVVLQALGSPSALSLPGWGGMCWLGCCGPAAVPVGSICQAEGTPGHSYHPSRLQVECNSKLDPTNTTFLKVGGWQAQPGGPCGP